MVWKDERDQQSIMGGAYKYIQPHFVQVSLTYSIGLLNVDAFTNTRPFSFRKTVLIHFAGYCAVTIALYNSPFEYCDFTNCHITQYKIANGFHKPNYSRLQLNN